MHVCRWYYTTSLQCRRTHSVQSYCCSFISNIAKLFTYPSWMAPHACLNTLMSPCWTTCAWNILIRLNTHYITYPAIYKAALIRRKRRNMHGVGRWYYIPAPGVEERCCNPRQSSYVWMCWCHRIAPHAQASKHPDLRRLGYYINTFIFAYYKLTNTGISTISR